MITDNMERLIKNLGCSYDALVANKLLADAPLQDLYEDGDTLEVLPTPGVELVFWPDTLRFEAIYVTICDSADAEQVYKGQLPAPFNSMKTKQNVHDTLGNPIYSKTLRELLGTGLSGWDTYQLSPNLHPAALADVQYKSDALISTIIFSVIDKNV